MITFAREPFDDMIAESLALTHAHWQETGVRHQELPLDPDYQRYSILDRSGVMRVYTARANGELVGYAYWMLVKPLQHRTVSSAINELLYLSPKARGPRVALRWLDYMEQTLVSEGVQAFFVNSRIEHPALRRLLEARGYSPLEMTHVKLVPRAEG